MSELANLLNIQCVKRWHIIDTSKPQSVAEHSFNVAIIAAEFCHQYDIPKAEVAYVVMRALTHDADEVDAGDVPSPNKGKPILAEWPNRIIQIADKLEAAWFAKHYAIGPRRLSVMEDTQRRFYDLVRDILDPDERGVWMQFALELLDE